MTVVSHTAMGEPMKDFDQRKGADDVRCEKCPLLTLGHAIAYSLLAQWKDEQPQWQEMWARARLADKVKNAEDDLTSEEVQKILPLLAKGYGPVVIGQALPLLDPAAAK